MPSLRKRVLKNGTVYWDIRYWKDGRRKVYKIGETDRRTATKIYHQFCGKFVMNEEDGAGESPDIRLADLAEKTREFATLNKSGKTSEREQLALANLIRVLGNISVSELTPDQIELYKASRLRDVSVHTVNLELRILNTAINQAKSLHFIPDSILGAFRLIRTPASEPPAWLNSEQIATILDHPDEQFRRFMLFALHTGCRRNEILGICWPDIDLPKRQIVVRGQIGKMGKLRTIPINDSLNEVLIKWPSERTGPLFPDYKSDSISQKFRRWVRSLGMPTGISLHSLRSTFACHLIDNGVDIYTVSRLLGHSSVKVTEKHYLTLEQGHVKAAVNKLSFGQ